MTIKLDICACGLVTVTLNLVTVALNLVLIFATARQSALWAISRELCSISIGVLDPIVPLVKLDTKDVIKILTIPTLAAFSF